jgi:hypothetical protein
MFAMAIRIVEDGHPSNTTESIGDFAMTVLQNIT